MRRLPRRAHRAVRAARRHPARVRVRAYLDSAPDALAHGFPADGPVTLAYDCTLPDGPDAVLLERVFAMFNDHPAHAADRIHTDAWYAEGLRSLSVGDVVALDDRHYRCQPHGWTRVPGPPA